MLTRDDFFGHRDPFTGEPRNDGTEWTDWDHALVHALQIIEDYTDEYGLLAWERDDEAAIIDAVKKIHPFKEAIDQRTTGSATKPYKPSPGEYFVPRQSSRRTVNGQEVYQTYAEWREKLAAEEA